MSVVHPRPDDHGKPVVIGQPSTPSGLDAWSDPAAVACVVPGGPMPAALADIPFAPWSPASPTDWPTADFDEPAGFKCPPGLKPAAGAVVVEPDGRVWLAMPTNRFGGLPYVFPKGRVDPGSALTATAMREVWEELGLRVRLTAYLVDVARSTTFTRLYLAQRVGGHPGQGMGWESQAAVLAPLAQLPGLLTHSRDAPVLAALTARLG